jgi:hypothetical protein
VFDYKDFFGQPNLDVIYCNRDKQNFFRINDLKSQLNDFIKFGDTRMVVCIRYHHPSIKLDGCVWLNKIFLENFDNVGV